MPLRVHQAPTRKPPPKKRPFRPHKVAGQKRITAAQASEINDLAADWAQSNGAWNITGIDAHELIAVQDVLQRALEAGWSDKQLDAALKPVIGVGPRYEAALQAYRAQLATWVSKGLITPELANHHFRQYFDALLQSRVRTVAEYEMGQALNNGLVQWAQQRQADGKLSNYAVLIFRTHKDEKTCPVCRPMNGRRISIASPSMIPPLHPNCRCRLVVSDLGSVQKAVTPFDELEEVIKRVVRTERGAAYFRQPIGTEIRDTQDPRDNVMGNLYLIHFHKPLGDPTRPNMSASHYLGWTEGPVEDRIASHAAGTGASITRAAVQRGIPWTVVWSRKGTRNDERRLKKTGHFARSLCPVCRNAKLMKNTPAEYAEELRWAEAGAAARRGRRKYQPPKSYTDRDLEPISPSTLLSRFTPIPDEIEYGGTLMTTGSADVAAKVGVNEQLVNRMMQEPEFNDIIDKYTDMAKLIADFNETSQSGLAPWGWYNENFEDPFEKLWNALVGIDHDATVEAMKKHNADELRQIQGRMISTKLYQQFARFLGGGSDEHRTMEKFIHLDPALFDNISPEMLDGVLYALRRLQGRINEQSIASDYVRTHGTTLNAPYELNGIGISAMDSFIWSNAASVTNIYTSVMHFPGAVMNRPYPGDTEEGHRIVKAALLTRKYIDTWARSSGDSNATSVALQRAVFSWTNDRFDHPAGEIDYLRRYASSGATWEEATAVLREDISFLMSFLDAVYEETQSYLKSKGLTSIPVFRGMYFPYDSMPRWLYDYISDARDEGGEESYGAYPGKGMIRDEVEMNPASSWCLLEDTAKWFAKGGMSRFNAIFNGNIPVEAVLATAVTGMGCLSENEVVVLGFPITVNGTWEDNAPHMPLGTVAKSAAVPVHIDAQIWNADWAVFLRNNPDFFERTR